MEWFFNGLGTALVGLIIGAFGGAFVGYRIGINKNNMYNQKARDNAMQVQLNKGDNNIGKKHSKS